MSTTWRTFTVRTWAGLTGLALGVGLGLLLISDEVAAAFIAVPLACSVSYLAWRVAPVGERRRTVAIILAAFAVRTAVAAVAYVGSVALGRGGFVTGDDAGYGELAWAFVQYLRGTPVETWEPPYWNGNAYLFGTYTYFVSAIFWIFGRHLPIVEMLNVAMASAMLVLVGDTARRLFGSRAALLTLIVVGFSPSLIVWSSLNLKDAAVLLLVALCFWLLARIHETRMWGLILLVLPLLLLMRGLRAYIYVAMTIASSVGLWTMPQTRRADRVRLGLLGSAGAALLLMVTGISGVWLTPDALLALESVRNGMASGARTSYAEPPPVIAQGGDTFVVTPPIDPLARASAPPGLTTAPRTFVVRPGTRIVLESAAAVDGTSQQGPYIVVRAGDIVVVGDPNSTAAPEALRRPLYLNDRRDTPSVTIESPAYVSQELVLNRTLAHIPSGFVHALLAPFPWDLRRVADVLTVPDVLLWYACVIAGLWVLWRERAKWPFWLPMFSFIVLIFGLFVLFEANTGILFRHRSMITPFAVTLASPGFIALADAICARFRMQH